MANKRSAVGKREIPRHQRIWGADEEGNISSGGRIAELQHRKGGRITEVDKMTPTGWVTTIRRTGKRKVYKIGSDGIARVIRTLPPLKRTPRLTRK
jgi:hypothetical protein